jgi:drug/metabolite transporter (DMT)-like permease
MTGAGIPARRPILLAAAWMSGALASFMAMAIAGRELSRELDTFQTLFWRSLVSLVVICLVLSRSGWGQVRTQRFGRHLLRNLVHFGGQFGWFYALAVLPLATVIAIEFTTPIWTLFIAMLMLGERLTRSRSVAVALGIAGMLVILRPGVLPIGIATLAVLSSAVAYALTYVFTKSLIRTDSPLCVLFYMALIQLPLGLVPALANWTVPSVALWPWVAVVGVTALTAHYSFARALAYADAMVVAPLDFLRLPLTALVGFAVYAEPLDWFVLGGAVLMLAGNLVNIRAERKQ